MADIRRRGKPVGQISQNVSGQGSNPKEMNKIKGWFSSNGDADSKCCNSKGSRLRWIPLTNVILTSIGVIVSAIIAIAKEHVTPYVPFISETGAYAPEGGIFSITFYQSAILGIATVVTRYLAVKKLNKEEPSKKISVTNKLAFAAGIGLNVGMVIVAAYPPTMDVDGHNLGAGLSFFGILFFCIFQTVLTYYMHPKHNSICIFWCRFAITFFTVGCLNIIGGSMYMVKDNYDNLRNLTAFMNRQPEDEGFWWIVNAGIFEWLMFAGFLMMYGSFYGEFKKFKLLFDIQPQVTNFSHKEEDENENEQPVEDEE